MSKDDPDHATRGRPKATEPGTTITAWVPTKEYDRLLKLANEKEQSLSSLIRQWMKLKR
jgi:hypothetical protein